MYIQGTSRNRPSHIITLTKIRNSAGNYCLIERKITGKTGVVISEHAKYGDAVIEFNKRISRLTSFPITNADKPTSRKKKIRILPFIDIRGLEVTAELFSWSTRTNYCISVISINPPPYSPYDGIRSFAELDNDIFNEDYASIEHANSAVVAVDMNK